MVTRKYHRKRFRKTRSKKQRGGTIFKPTTREELQDAVNRWTNDEKEGLGNISDWNTSNITHMGSLFRDKKTFNDDISNWNVSNVTVMANMFSNAYAFNNGQTNNEGYCSIKLGRL